MGAGGAGGRGATWKGPDAPKEEEAGEQSEPDSRREPQGARELGRNRSPEDAWAPAGKGGPRPHKRWPEGPAWPDRAPSMGTARHPLRKPVRGPLAPEPFGEEGPRPQLKKQLPVPKPRVPGGEASQAAGQGSRHAPGQGREPSSGCCGRRRGVHRTRGREEDHASGKGEDRALGPAQAEASAHARTVIFRPSQGRRGWRGCPPRGCLLARAGWASSLSLPVCRLPELSFLKLQARRAPAGSPGPSAGQGQAPWQSQSDAGEQQRRRSRTPWREAWVRTPVP